MTTESQGFQLFRRNDSITCVAELAQYLSAILVVRISWLVALEGIGVLAMLVK